ncbi:alpha/beta-hydrolase, partial [Athelia psychrophila]
YLRLRFLAAIIRMLIFPGTWHIKRRQTMVEGSVYKRTTVPSRDTTRSITVDLYQPPNYDSTKPAPAMINMHGSGFLIPMLGTDRRYCSTIAARTGSIVFDIDYRKAPEHPYPAATQDLEDVVAYLGAHPARYDAANIFLSGFSAGGMIALATSAALGPARIKGVVAIYAMADSTTDYPAPEKQGEGGSVPGWIGRAIRESYYLPGVDRADPRISAQFAPAERFPKHVYLACGTTDGTHGNGEALVRKLQEAGHGDATFESVEHEGHAFDKGKPDTMAAAKADRMYEAAAAMVNRALRS